MKERVLISSMIFFWVRGWGELIITTTEKRYSNLSSNSKENTNVT